jgi:cytochrome c oxidase subunit 2
MRRSVPFALAPVLAACGGVQSSAGRDGVESDRIAGLFELFLWTTIAVYAFVIVFLVMAVVRGRRRSAADAPPQPDERRWRLGLYAFAGTSAAILFVLSLATFLTDRGIARAQPPPALEIELIGHQWWWEVRYRDPIAGNIVRTANELHLPAGKTARIKLLSTDVIHSLWIPKLAGKQDLIPGREVDLVLHPLRKGDYRSQCAEFCGLQHAHMALDVTVESPSAFIGWYNAALKTPPKPTGGAALAGYALFQTRQCSSCHTIAGTEASGMVAPDLSHIASRKTIAAGTLPMDHRLMALWIADPQSVKPGNYMPKVPLTDAEIGALTAYLETLK